MTTQSNLPRLLPVGDTGLSVEFGDAIDPTANQTVASLDRALAVAELPGLIETVPSFRSLLVVYEPAIVPWDVLRQQVQALLAKPSAAETPQGRRWSIPMAYEPPFGEDLAEAASILGLAEDQVVALHAGAEFRVYMLGFQPGLPNLGGLPAELRLSRRTAPRAPVPPRSVAIGGVQGAIFPMATPTGFYMLGRTPVRPFDRRRRDNPALFRPGDIIRFSPISAAEYAELDAAAEAGDLFAGAMTNTEPASP
jgi:KipI family sensor histidine kinase inhibitor